VGDYRSVYARDDNLIVSDDFSSGSLGSMWSTGNSGASSTGAGSYNVSGNQLNVTKVAYATGTLDEFYVKRATYAPIPSGASVEVHGYIAISDVGSTGLFNAGIFLSPTNPTGLVTAESQGLRFFIQDSGTSAASTGYTRVLQSIVNGTVTTLKSEQVSYVGTGVNFDQPVYAVYNSGTSYTDNSGEAQSSGGTPFNLITYSGSNYFYFGRPEPFLSMQVTLSTTGNYGTRLWQYWNGSAWQSGTALASGAVGLTDGTTGFNTNGVVSWGMPGDWQPTGISGAGSRTAKTVTVSGATIDTGQSPSFGTGVGKFVAASSQYLSLADSDDWAFGTGNFTIDFWVRFNSFPTTGNHMDFYAQSTNASNYVEIGLRRAPDTDLRWVWSVFTGGTDIVGIVSVYPSPDLVLNTWYHMAYVRSGSTFYLFQDGSLITSVTNATAFPDLTSSLWLGAFPDSTNFLDGWLDEFRISKGVARWTSNFTPPTTPYTTDAYTVLLLHMESDFTDDNGAGGGINAYWVRVSAASVAYAASANQILASKTTHYYHPFMRLCLDYANVRVDLDSTGTAWLAATGHNLQFRTPLDSMFVNSGATYTDNTAESASPSGTAFNLLTYSGTNYAYFGRTEPFTSLWFKLSTTGNYGVRQPLFEYWNGSAWTSGTALASGVIVDGTSVFSTHTGVVSWTQPSDWQPTTVSGVQRYWIRESVPSGSFVTASAYQILAGPANYFYTSLITETSRGTAETATFDCFEIRKNPKSVSKI
jgi:Concanavalin A-like lectin/glucanases superfamily